MRLKRSLSLVSILLSALLIAACGGLAGEPEIVGQMPTLSAPISSELTPPDTQPDLALGAQIFAVNCVRCHGETGAGDGEFVQSGQITDIPNFTDPAQHEGRTPAEYYTMVTNGNLEKLMPPFSGSLSEHERWSVANYVLTLAGDDLPLAVADAPIATEEASIDSAETTAPSNEAQTGTISGSVLQGTVGGTVLDSGMVTLTIVEMTGAQSTFTAEIDTFSTYEFMDLPIIEGAGYFVSIDYGNGTFNSEFASLTAESPEINLNVQIYETTDDDSVINLEVVLTQIDVLDDSSLRIWQLITVRNTSDKLYVYTDDRGQSVSVEVPAPVGVRLSPDIDISRFVFNDSSVYDTQPVLPGTEHSFHLLYTAPYNGVLTFSQSFPYDFSGPYEAYVDSSQLRLSGDGWQTIDSAQEIQGVTYLGIAKVDGLEANTPISFTVQQTGFDFDNRWLGYAVITIGVILIVVAGIFYWRAPNTPQSDHPETVQTLMKEIASLDDLFQNGEINQQDYEAQRKALKDQVTALMKAENS